MISWKYYKHYISCFTLFFFFAQQATSFSGKYPIQNFTPADYQAGIQNIDFAQNRDMTLFVANNLSVLSFNGNAWSSHNRNTGKKNRSLVFDESMNRLYVGAQGELGFYEEDWQYRSLNDLIPEGYQKFDEVWDVYILHKKVYFCTFQGIYIYDGKKITVLTKAEGLDRSFVSDGKLLTQSKGGGFFEVDDAALVPVLPANPLHEILAGVVAYEGGYLLFYNSGVIELTTPFGNRRQFSGLMKALEGTYVNHVLQLSDTRLAIATQTAGLFLFDLQEQAIEQITARDGLATNACLRSFQDYYGNLWVGMQNGIALIHINSPMRILNQDLNLQGSGYEAYETSKGTYFTTSNGIYFLKKGAAQSTFILGTEGPAYGIQEVAGKLYAGHHTGLFALDNGNAQHIATIDGLWDIKHLKANPEYVIGGTYSGLFLFKINDSQTLEPIQLISGFDLSSRFFEEDEQGRIWVGQYYQGLYALSLSEDLRQATVYNLKDANDEQIILSSVGDGLYLATNKGVFQLDPTQNRVGPAEMFTKKIGKQPVYLFEQDRKNNVYVLAERGVGFFKQISNGNYQYMPSSLYQLRYYLNNDLLHASVNTKEGILFSGNRGFIHYNPELEDPLRVQQPLVIRQVFSVTENKTLYKQEPFEVRPQEMLSIEVSPHAKVLKIDVESFQFNDLNNASFRYWLKGFEDGFGEWTTTPTKEYTNLSGGNYEFVAQTRNYLGKTITSLPLYLEVKPPFYNSMAAKFLYVILGIIALVLISRLQKQRYKQKTKQIREEKRWELAKKQQRILEMEQQKERELLQLKDEKMQSELEHVNNLLAASTMNLAVKNEFIESIKEELERLNQGGNRAGTKRALEKIVKEIDITLKLQEDWEQFEYHFDKVHGDFSTRLRQQFPELSPNEQKLCALLRLNLNTKEIANMLSISQRGVEVARYRLRKKLDLEKGQNLSKFILEY